MSRLLSTTYSDDEYVARWEKWEYPSPLKSDTRTHAHEQTRVIQQVLKTLTKRESLIIQLSMGMVDGYEYSLPEIGEMFMLTSERIRLLKSVAIRKLKHSTRHVLLEACYAGVHSQYSHPHFTS